MDSLDLSAPIIVCFVALIPLLIALLCTFMATDPRLPPSPRGLPIIGSLHHVGRLPHRGLRRLSATYGPLLYLKLGSIPTLVVSSPEAAAEVFKTHDLKFGNHPETKATRILTYGFLGLSFTHLSDEWKNMRAFVIQELFSPRKIRSLQPSREKEVEVLINSIKKQVTISGKGGGGGAPTVNVGAMAFCLFSNINLREVFGRRDCEGDDCLESRFHGLLKELMSLVSGLRLEDYFPSLWWVAMLTGANSAINKAFGKLDGFLEEEIVRASRELEEDDEGGEPCLLKTLLRLERSQSTTSLGFAISRDRIKALLLDVFLRGADAPAVALEWAMTEMMRNAGVMARAQEEVRGVAGRKSRVEEADVEHLPYLRNVVKETLRFHPPGVVPFPHENSEECEVLGYRVPAKTRVIVNVWAINRDPEHWEEPERFWPERFEEGKAAEVDYRRHGFRFLSFGGGRRMCPAMMPAVHEVELALANLLHCFDWELPEGKEKEEVVVLDVEESFALSTRKKNPLLLKPINPAVN